jgi:hypothetical protein
MRELDEMSAVVNRMKVLARENSWGRGVVAGGISGYLGCAIAAKVAAWWGDSLESFADMLLTLALFSCGLWLMYGLYVLMRDRERK